MINLRRISNILPLQARSSLSAENHLREVFGVETSRRRLSDKPISRSAEVPVNEIENIRIEFEDAKRSFLNIPAALREMPKMSVDAIYANKFLRLDNLQAYGFDYDYTLAHYSTNLQSLIYDLAKEFLVSELKYPGSCLRFQYDQSFPIRGLYFDKHKGCLLKLDFFGSIEPDCCFLGRQKLCREEIVTTYGSRHIGRDHAEKLVCLMDFFCFSEACLIADIVQHFIDAKMDFVASYVYDDVSYAIRHVHRSGILHRTIHSNPEKYLMKNNQALKFLMRLRENGKKLFLLTNSPYKFVDGGMRFLLEGCGVYRDSWRDLFDIVIASAEKPTFYTSDQPFRCYNIEKDSVAITAVERFLPDQVYYHGCLSSFLQITKWNGNEVIYFGDHLFNDLKGPSKAGWKTAAIIHELEREIRIQNTEDYRCQQAKYHVIQELLGKFHMAAPKCGEQSWHSLLDELNDERKRCLSLMRNMFNGSFGATFLADGGQESAFAYYIHHHADVFTSKLDNFLLYPPEAWLQVPFDVKIMPHHVKVPSSLFKQQ